MYDESHGLKDSPELVFPFPVELPFRRLGFELYALVGCMLQSGLYANSVSGKAEAAGHALRADVLHNLDIKKV